jgi:hypothetical protein
MRALFLLYIPFDLIKGPLMSKEGKHADPRAEAFDNACALYNSLSESLLGVIEILKKKSETGAPLTKAESEVVREHQKALLMVLGFETDVLKRHGAAFRDGPVLDLDAARAEVARRLARLQDAPQPGAAPEGTER